MWITTQLTNFFEYSRVSGTPCDECIWFYHTFYIIICIPCFMRNTYSLPLCSHDRQKVIWEIFFSFLWSIWRFEAGQKLINIGDIGRNYEHVSALRRIEAPVCMKGGLITVTTSDDRQ